MGSVFKKTATKPLPAGAKIIVRKGQRFAEWKPAKGKARTAPLTVGQDGTDRIVVTARTFTAKYRDGGGVVQEVATGCRDRTAAESVLADLEKRAEKVKGKILTAAEDRMIDHQQTPMTAHVRDYLASLVAIGRDDGHIDNLTRQLGRLVRECPFSTLTDLKRERLESWLAGKSRAGMSARTRNSYRGAAVAFCNWCIETGRLAVNPFSKIEKVNEGTDTRRQRRALTEDELRRLLDVARRRPLEDRSTVYKGPRKGQRYAKLRPEVQRRLERLGRERALTYKVLVLTGLRKGELASLTVGQLDLDADPPYLTLDAGDEKNREGNSIPLRADLAADLSQWLGEKAAIAQEAAREAPAVRFDSEHQKRDKRSQGDSTGREGQSCQPLTRLPFGLPADTPLFTVPRGLVRILDRDLRAAGIPKRDERGRTVDVHALRTSFGTLLSKGGVSPRTAQAAMRHSTINLTMNTYTDPKLLDVAGAVESLPALPLGDGSQDGANILSATGTDDLTACQFAPKFAPTVGKPLTLQSIVDRTASAAAETADATTLAASACQVKRKDPLTIAVNGPHEGWLRGLEPPTSRSTIWHSNQLSYSHRETVDLLL